MSDKEIDQRIQAAAVGDRAALDSVADDLYAQLHAIASQHMRSERVGSLLQTTAIVHEAYLKFNPSPHTMDVWLDKFEHHRNNAAQIQSDMIRHEIEQFEESYPDNAELLRSVFD